MSTTTETEVLAKIHLIVVPDRTQYELVDPDRHAERKAIMMRFVTDVLLEKSGKAGFPGHWGTLDREQTSKHLPVRHIDGSLDPVDLADKINERLTSYFEARRQARFSIPEGAAGLAVDAFELEDVYYDSDFPGIWCSTIGHVAWIDAGGSPLARWMMSEPGEVALTAEIQLSIRFEMLAN